MTCDEVMELMQRHLDGDLTEEEYNHMMSHLEACPECAEFKERLERIDRDLASLPKVTPPYSLVDAILPQLEQLDASLGSGGNDEGAASQLVKPARSKWYANRRLMQWGGVGAAAALLGILVVNGLPTELEKASTVRTLEMESTASSAGMAEPSSGAAPGAAALMAATEGSERKSLDSPVQAESGVRAMESADGVPNASAQETDWNPSVADGPAAKGNGEAVPDSAAEDVHTPSVQDAETANSSARITEADVPPAEPNAEGAGFGIAGIPGEREPLKDAEQASITSMHSPEVAPELRRLESADGRLAAQVQAVPENGSLQLAIVDQSGNTVFLSDEQWSADTEITLLNWEGTLLTYSVETPEGERVFTIDAAAKLGSEIVRNP